MADEVTRHPENPEANTPTIASDKRAIDEGIDILLPDDSSPAMNNDAAEIQLIAELLNAQPAERGNVDPKWHQSPSIAAPQPQSAPLQYGQSAPLPSVESIIFASIAASDLAQSCPPTYPLAPMPQVSAGNFPWRQRTDSFTSAIPDDTSTVTTSSLEDCFSPSDEYFPAGTFAFTGDQSTAPATGQSCDPTIAGLMPSPPTVPDNADSFLLDEIIGGMFPMDSLVKVKPELLSAPQRSYESHLNFISPSTGDTSITISRQPPTVYRARYRTETAETKKGQLRDREKEPVSIGMESVPEYCDDLPVKMTVVTNRGQPHPTITPFCFGKTMPKDWKTNSEEKSVTTTLQKKENYFKRMSFLAIARQKAENVDTGKYQHNELNSFKIQFEVQIPTAGGSYKKVTQTTRPVQAVCPNKMTRLRKAWRGEVESPTKSPTKRIKFN